MYEIMRLMRVQSVNFNNKLMQCFLDSNNGDAKLLYQKKKKKKIYIEKSAVNGVRATVDQKSLGSRCTKHRANSSERVCSHMVTMTGKRKDEDQRVQRRTREQGVK